MTVYTGVMLAGLTPWGYTRFWWVGVKLVLALACALLGRAAFGRWLAEAATAAQPVPGGALISGSALTIIAIAFMAWAARTKPWGRIGRNRASPRPWAPPALWVLAIVTPVADYLTGLPLQAVPVTIVLGHHARRSFSTGSRSPSVVHPNPATGEGAEVVVDPSSTPAPSSPPSCAARIDHPAKRRRAQ